MTERWPPLPFGSSARPDRWPRHDKVSSADVRCHAQGKRDRRYVVRGSAGLVPHGSWANRRMPCLVSPHLMYFTRKGRDDVSEEGGAFHFPGMLVELDVGKLRVSRDNRIAS